MPPKSKRSRSEPSPVVSKVGGGSVSGGGTPLASINGPRSSCRTRTQRFPELDLSQLADANDDDKDFDEDEDYGTMKKAVPKPKRDGKTASVNICSLSPAADQALQLVRGLHQITQRMHVS